jgi:MarR family transcriptional regulator, temperature-dependent positive regulator of motility
MAHSAHNLRQTSANESADEPTAALRDRMLAGNDITLAWRLNNLANHYSVPLYRAIEQASGLSRSEFVILMCLAHHPGITAQEIVDTSGRPKNSVSVSMSKLERKGLILRHPSAVDSRRMELNLTDLGREAYDEIMPLLKAREAAMVRVLTDTESRRLAELLLKVGLSIANWEPIEVPPSLARWKSL